MCYFGKGSNSKRFAGFFLLLLFILGVNVACNASHKYIQREESLACVRTSTTIEILIEWPINDGESGKKM